MTNEPLILLIDDDQAFREIISLKLSSSGFRVETAPNGIEGIQKAREIKPALILMDMKMPNMDGAEAIAKLKDDPNTKDIKIVFLTQYGASEDDGEKLDSHFALSAGALGYMRKSEDLNKIVEQVKSFLKT